MLFKPDNFTDPVAEQIGTFIVIFLVDTFFCKGANLLPIGMGILFFILRCIFYLYLYYIIFIGIYNVVVHYCSFCYVRNIMIPNRGYFNRKL